MTIYRNTVYTTVDGKEFKNLNDAEEHEQELKELMSKMKYIKQLSSEKKQLLLDYCSAVILIMKADLSINNTYQSSKGTTGLTQLPTKVNDEDITSGFYLSDTGQQINTILSEVGLKIIYDTDIEGRYKSITPEILGQNSHDTFDVNKTINKITKLLS